MCVFKTVSEIFLFNKTFFRKILSRNTTDRTQLSNTREAPFLAACCCGREIPSVPGYLNLLLRAGHGRTEHRKQLLGETLLLSGDTAWIFCQLGVLGPNLQLANFEEIKHLL